MVSREKAFRRRRLILLALLAFLLPITLTGCGAHPAASPLLGAWQGTMTSGNLSVPCRWKLRGDGAQSVTLTLPQGLLTANGTFTFHNDALTLRTMGRTITLNGEKKVMPLVNPMETTYQCRLTGETLTLTRADTHEKITLTREKS